MSSASTQLDTWNSKVAKCLETPLDARGNFIADIFSRPLGSLAEAVPVDVKEFVPKEKFDIPAFDGLKILLGLAPPRPQQPAASSSSQTRPQHAAATNARPSPQTSSPLIVPPPQPLVEEKEDVVLPLPPREEDPLPQKFPPIPPHVEEQQQTAIVDKDLSPFDRSTEFDPGEFGDLPSVNAPMQQVNSTNNATTLHLGNATTQGKPPGNNATTLPLGNATTQVKPPGNAATTQVKQTKPATQEDPF